MAHAVTNVTMVNVTMVNVTMVTNVVLVFLSCCASPILPTVKVLNK